MADKRTQKAEILSWLRTRGGLTVREAMLELNINSAPKRIQELKQDGYKIRTDYKTAPSGKRYGVYTLVEETR